MEETFPKFLLKKIHEIEDEKGRQVTLDEVAELWHVKRPSISHWMSGRVKPSLESAFILAPVIGPEVFLYLDIDLDPDLIYINYYWEKLDADQRRMVRGTVENYAVEEKKDGE